MTPSGTLAIRRPEWLGTEQGMCCPAQAPRAVHRALRHDLCNMLPHALPGDDARKRRDLFVRPCYSALFSLILESPAVLIIGTPGIGKVSAQGWSFQRCSDDVPRLSLCA